MREENKTIFYSFLSGIVGGVITYETEVHISPALFAVGVLVANHAHIELRHKLLAYLMLVPIAMADFLFGGMVFTFLGALLTGFILEGLSVYFGSGLCAVVFLFFLHFLVGNVRFDFMNSAVVFLSGAVSLLVFFLFSGLPLDNLYRDLDPDRQFFLMFLFWQTLVGLGIAWGIKRGCGKEVLASQD